MRPGTSFITFWLAAVLTLTIILLTSCKPTQKGAAQEDPSSGSPKTTTGLTLTQVDVDHPVTAATEPAAEQGVAVQDGHALVKLHCAGCHIVIPHDQVKKSRLEWEEVLDRMEGMGVKLSETEKETLLDYLSAAGAP